MNGAEAEKIEEHYTPSLEVAKVMIKDYFERRHGAVIDYVDLGTRSTFRYLSSSRHVSSSSGRENCRSQL